MFTNSGHLTYCTNIHAGESWKDHFKALKENFPAIKKQLSSDKPMGIGLRLSNEASLELIKEENLHEFQQWLKDNDAYVFTMNGFPYGGFHRTRVKENVHTPDWTTDERVQYTIRLFQILKELLPEGMDGGVSTSPLSYRHWFKTIEALTNAKKTATNNMIKVAEELINIQKNTGKILHLDIEPEPDGMMETGMEFLQWYKNNLLPEGRKIIAEKFSVIEDEAEKLLKRHITLCFDVCHFAIGYEPHTKIIKDILTEGIKIGKIQISAALKGEMNKEAGEREKIKQSFERFNEPVYLHQVVARKNDNSLIRYPDLPEALEDYNHADVVEWRSHFHVPISAEDFGLLQSTNDDIIEALKLQKENPFTNHLEVETYTWEVLPGTLKIPLQQSIVNELKWVMENL